MTKLYRHLDLNERIQIQILTEQGLSARAIARKLDRSPSTITRELEAGKTTPEQVSPNIAFWESLTLNHPTSAREVPYLAEHAHHKAQARKARSHQHTRMRYRPLAETVLDWLQRGWTPMQISLRLPIDFPDDTRMRVSVETLYAWIYSGQRLNDKLYEYLPRGRKKRWKKHGRRVHSSRINYRQSIHTRPEEINTRAQGGHWEIDSVVGLRGTGVIHTCVERTSRYLYARVLPAATAEATRDAMLAFVGAMPAEAVRSFTADNGSEFAWHYQVKDQTGVPTYFADPYSAWQRGTNENRNGILRRYLPKRTSFSDLSQEELDTIVAEINNRPMRVHGGFTPAEIFDEIHSDRNSPKTRCCASD